MQTDIEAILFTTRICVGFFFSVGTSCSFERLYQFCHYEETYGPEAIPSDPERHDHD